MTRPCNRHISGYNKYNVQLLTKDKATIVRTILESIPEWFGRRDALEKYVAAAERLPTFGVSAVGEAIIGFASIERHNDVAAEIHAMGVLREWHGQGCGRKLVSAAVKSLAASGTRWLTVKTVAATHPDPNYAETRRFYETVGFEPLEVFTDLWGQDTPCLYMVRPLFLIDDKNLTGDG